MDITIPMFFWLIGFISLLIAIYEEKEGNDDDSDMITIILFVISFIAFIVGGACMYGITDGYYSTITDSWELSYRTEYRPVAWFGFGTGFFVLFLLILKIFDTLGKQGEQEQEL